MEYQDSRTDREETAKAAAEAAEPSPEAAAAEETAAEQEDLQEEKDPLSELQKKFDQLDDQYKRLAAEFDNYRKRTQREKDAIYPDAVANTVKGFLNLADGFERALEAPCADPEFKKGVEMTCRMLFDQFEKLGVEPVGAPGEAFDPRFHNAVMHVEDGETGANAIVEVFQKGYKIGERVLRYAMVKVAN